MKDQDLNIDTKIRLNNGIEMPILGLGTYQAHRGREAEEAVLWALEFGYKHVDTAKLYGNEQDIGRALRKSGIPREEVFITTKLWNSDHGYKNCLDACDESLDKLGLAYLDLYLIHWPVESIRYETWSAMETLLEGGKCRAVGVSNYTIGHLKELLGLSALVPAVNQVEFSPYLYQKDLLEFCGSRDIQLESYSPLTKGNKLNDPKLAAMAYKYSKSPAQILIRWVLQHEIAVIPKSSRKERIKENADVFDFSITLEDMNTLDSFHENLRTSWDPTSTP
jgi:diketogulonate reductase-like aldo/keto reductase